MVSIPYRVSAIAADGTQSDAPNDYEFQFLIGLIKSDLKSYQKSK